MRTTIVTVGLALVAAAVGADSYSASGNGNVEWRYFGGSRHMDRYSPVAQISKANVGQLQVLWTRPGLDASITSQFPDISPSPYLRGTPIMIDGVLYAPDAVGLVEAFDPMTGKTLWIQKPFEATLKEAAGQSTRTVDVWGTGADRRIVVVRGRYLYELNPKTGEAITSFGEQGRVLLDRRDPKDDPFRGANGPIVVGDSIVIGGNGVGSVGDGGFEAWASPEDIRAWDARTGKQIWTFHVVKPDPASWGKDSYEHVGNMAAWAPLSADEQLGIVYVPTSAPTVSYYGGHRPGNNLYSDCLLAIDAKSGKLVWYFQTVHHDMWDYDNASPPTLADIKVNGRMIHAVIQPNKSGYLYVFDRKTGKPVWPIEERAAPKPFLPGEAASPTQPIPTKPPKLDRGEVTPGDLIDFTPQLHAEAEKVLGSYITGPVFTPPSLADDPKSGKRGTLGVPGAWGTANWNTGAFDPDTGIYYAVTSTFPTGYGLHAAGPEDRGEGKALYGLGGGTGAPRNRPPAPTRVNYGLGVEGMPLLKPPYGRLTAVDMNKGEQLWMVANGEGPREDPSLKALNLPPLGTVGRPAALVTKTLVFLGEASNAVDGQGVVGPGHFYAYDKATGNRLWDTVLPAGTTGGPVTYEIHGKQFVVVPVGSRDYGTAWVALGLKQ